MTAPTLAESEEAEPVSATPTSSSEAEPGLDAPSGRFGRSGSSEPIGPDAGLWAGLSRARRITLYAATSATLLAVLFIGFVGYLFGFSRLQEEHSQSTLYKTLALHLGDATAPVAEAPDGAPVAVLDIPAAGIHQSVVVEGTTGTDLARGPGHLRYSVLPGQAGVSVLFGRRATFGAPFAHVPALRIGDVITVTTGQGRFTYIVNAFGTGAHPILDTAPNRLLLVTSDSTWIPTHTDFVGARLNGLAAETPARAHTVVPADAPLASDDNALPRVQLWSLALLLAVLVATLGWQLWSRRATYLAMAPVLAALVWCVYENVAILLPNLY